MTLTFERFSDNDKMNQSAKYLSQRSFVLLPKHTNRHTRPTDCFTWAINSNICLAASNYLLLKLLCRYYLCQGGYVIVVVCLSVCLSVSNFAQKLPNGFV